jgi:hypothetical protein
MPEHEFEAILARAAEEGAKRARRCPARGRRGRARHPRPAFDAAPHDHDLLRPLARGARERLALAERSKHIDSVAFDIAMSNHDPPAFEAAARQIGFLGSGPVLGS